MAERRAPMLTERRPRKALVPDVVGLRLDDAAIVLQQAGFPPPQPRFTLAYADEHTVVEQVPAKGHLVESNTAVQLYVARQTWVRYLPQLYQEATSGDNQLLHEFLWIFQQVHDRVDRQLASLPALFDPRTTEPAFLPWLASWMTLQLEADWPLERQRQWLRRAPALYAIRGTRKALEATLAMFSGEAVQVLENAWPFEPFRIGVASEIGVTTTVLPPMELAHCFVVQLPRSASEYTDDEIVRIHRVIQAEKPAHTQYFLTFFAPDTAYELQPFLTIGEDALAVGESDPASE